MGVKPGGCAVRSIIPCPHPAASVVVIPALGGPRFLKLSWHDRILLLDDCSTCDGVLTHSFPRFMTDPAALDSAHFHWTKDRTQNHSAHQVEISVYGDMPQEEEELFSCYRYMLEYGVEAPCFVFCSG